MSADRSTFRGGISRWWTGRAGMRARRLATWRRHQELRVGVVQAVYVALALTLAVMLPSIHEGPMSQAAAVAPLMRVIAGGLISAIALVFSLLFLVVQYGNSSISPRLTLFRDAPLVWHSFGVFIAVFVYAGVSALELGARTGAVSTFVPAVGIAGAAAALLLSRTLQLRALRLLQPNAAMEEVRARGEAAIERVYDRQFGSAGGQAPVVLADVATAIVWDRPAATLRQIDVPRLCREAARRDAIVRIHVRVGSPLLRGAAALTVHTDEPMAPGAVSAASEAMLACLLTGIDRRFEQDPLLAFRLLSDIGNHATSAAVHDPATALQALTCACDLLVVLSDRPLDIGALEDVDGRPRVVLALPDWEEYVAAATDEIADYGADEAAVRAGARTLLADLRSRLPPECRPAIERRLRELASPESPVADQGDECRQGCSREHR